MQFTRHCERSEAIQTFFVSPAMTVIDMDAP